RGFGSNGVRRLSAVCAIPRYSIYIVSSGILLGFPTAACRILPFSLGRQAERISAPGVQLQDKLLRIIPGYRLDRIVVSFLEAGRIIPHNFLPLALSYAVFPNPKTTHRHFMLRRLIGWAIACRRPATHLVRPSLDPYEFHSGGWIFPLPPCRACGG